MRVKLQVFFAKEPYKRDNILPKRPIIARCECTSIYARAHTWRVLVRALTRICSFTHVYGFVCVDVWWGCMHRAYTTNIFKFPHLSATNNKKKKRRFYDSAYTGSRKTHQKLPDVSLYLFLYIVLVIKHCNTLPHAATHCNILQHTATTLMWWCILFHIFFSSLHVYLFDQLERKNSILHIWEFVRIHIYMNMYICICIHWYVYIHTHVYTCQ